MNLVHDHRKEIYNPNNEKDGALKKWLLANSQYTIARFNDLEKDNFKKPINIKS